MGPALTPENRNPAHLPNWTRQLDQTTGFGVWTAPACFGSQHLAEGDTPSCPNVPLVWVLLNSFPTEFDQFQPPQTHTSHLTCGKLLLDLVLMPFTYLSVLRPAKTTWSPRDGRIRQLFDQSVEPFFQSSSLFKEHILYKEPHTPDFAVLPAGSCAFRLGFLGNSWASEHRRSRKIGLTFRGLS